MDYTDKIFANIAKDMAEQKDVSVVRAFVFQITELLQKNGIMPICTERYMNINSDKLSYSFIRKINISFDELDCTKHDREVRKQAYRDFINEFEGRVHSTAVSEKLFETECILLERDKNGTT